MPKGRRGSPRSAGKKIEASTRGHPYKGQQAYEGYKEYMRKYMRRYRKRELVGIKRKEYNFYMCHYMRKYREKKRRLWKYGIVP